MKCGWMPMVAATVILVGCTPTSPPTTPAPTPTFMCTPEAGGAEAPCSQQDYDKMKAKDEQYAEAEKVYREYLAEYVRVMRATVERTSSLPALKDIVADKELATSICWCSSRLQDSGTSARRDPGIEIISCRPTAGRLLKVSQS